MFTLTVENIRGEKLTLTQNESKYQVINIDGLNPPKALIHNSTIAGMDGTKHVSAKLEERNLVLDIKINGNIEANRLNLYSFIKTKQWCKIYYKNGSRNVYTEGYVETVENNLFTLGQVVQISIVCNDPYFKSMELIRSDISHVVPAFAFPFAFGAEGIIADTTTDEAIEFSLLHRYLITNIHNDGEADTGVSIDIYMNGEVTDPVVYNNETQEYFKVNAVFMQRDRLLINTSSGERRVTLIRNGISTNYINHVDRTSTWLTLGIGDNQFTYSAEAGTEQMQIVFTHRAKYEAV